jgi:exodeoxyribonuclease VII large subunit
MDRLNRQSRQIVLQRLDQERSRWMALNRSLLRASPDNRLRLQRRRAKDLRLGGQRAIAAHLRSHRLRLDSLQRQLDALDPLAILSRGYAVLSDAATGDVVSRADQVRPGIRLRARVSDGDFGVVVEDGP